LPYLEATELTECMQLMGEENKEYCRQEVLGEVPPRPSMNLTIIRENSNDHTFLSTERLSFTVQIPNSPVTAPSTFNWKVIGRSADAGNGNPYSASNQSKFSFRPNPVRPTSGSRVPNNPIEYRVTASSGSNAFGEFDLIQDETDIVRQEYIDLGA